MKSFDAVGRVDLHDVPEDGPAADLDHRLGLKVSFFRQARAQTARENDSLHESLVSMMAGSAPNALLSKIFIFGTNAANSALRHHHGLLEAAPIYPMLFAFWSVAR